MLVSNSCVHDTRVIRAAETVAEQGFDMVVLAVADGRQASEERQNGVLYKRLPKPGALRRSLRGEPEAVPSGPETASSARGARLPQARMPRARGLYRAIVRINYQCTTRTAFLDEITILGRPIRRAPGGAFRLATDLVRRLIAFGIRRLHFIMFQLDVRRMRRMFRADLMELSPNVIHAHDLVMLPAAAVAAKSLGAKLIYDSHELEVHRNTKTGVIDKWLRSRIESTHIKRCDAVITVCDSIANHLAGEYMIKRPTVVMNAPDMARDVPCNTDLRSSLELPSETPLAVYVGRITVGRGIEQVVDAWQYLPEFHLALVGAVNPPTVEIAQKRAVELGVRERLHIVKPVAPNMVVSFIRSSDVSVVPIQNVCLSYYYCLPNKLLESAFANLPVVVSDFPELRRFVEISGSGLTMNERDPRDIARAVREAYHNRERLRPDSERLRRAQEIYGWPKQRDTLKALYSSFNLLPNQAPDLERKPPRRTLDALLVSP